MKGYVRITNLRPNMGSKPDPDEIEIVIDRSHPILGNQKPLVNKHDRKERAGVIEWYQNQVVADEKVKGPMYRAILDIARRVQNGEKICLGCWCDPMPCHGGVIRDRVNRWILEWALSAGETPPGLPSTQASSLKCG